MYMRKGLGIFLENREKPADLYLYTHLLPSYLLTPSFSSSSSSLPSSLFTPLTSLLTPHPSPLTPSPGTPSPPQSVQLMVVNQTNILVSWQPPLDDGHLEILEYNVRGALPSPPPPLFLSLPLSPSFPLSLPPPVTNKQYPYLQ